MAEYQVVAVARTPSQLGSPSLVEMGLLRGDFEYEHSLDVPDTFRQTVATASLEQSIKDRMRQMDENPLEVVVYRDDTKVFSGPILALEVNSEDQTVTITARSKLMYVAYMVLDYDFFYAAEDQFAIVRNMVQNWQSQDWGNFGIDVSDVNASGITRDWEVVADEYQNALDTIYEISNLDNGFDVWVDPTNDKLMLAHPQRGSDLTDTVFIERGIEQGGSRITVAPEVIASVVYVTADDGTASATNSAIRQSFGHTGKVIASQRGVAAQATAEAVRFEKQLYVPGAAYIPMPESAVDSFDVGDTISYSHDAGLGLVEGQFRVLRKKVMVQDNQENVEVQFV